MEDKRMNTFLLLEGGTPNAGGNLLFTVGYFVILIAVFWLLILRPQKKRQKQEEEMRSNIAVGDIVVMTSGIVGKVICIKDDEVTIENGLARTQLTFVKGAVSSVKVKNESGEAPATQSVDDKRAELQRKLDEKNAAKKAEKEAAKKASVDDKIDLK